MSTPNKNRSDTAARSADMMRDSGVMIQGMTETLLDAAMEKGRKDGVNESFLETRGIAEEVVERQGSELLEDELTRREANGGPTGPSNLDGRSAKAGVASKLVQATTASTDKPPSPGNADAYRSGNDLMSAFCPTLTSGPTMTSMPGLSPLSTSVFGPTMTSMPGLPPLPTSDFGPTMTSMPGLPPLPPLPASTGFGSAADPPLKLFDGAMSSATSTAHLAIPGLQASTVPPASGKKTVKIWKWTTDETEKLAALIDKNGTAWTKIKEMMGGDMTVEQISYRGRKIIKEKKEAEALAARAQALPAQVLAIVHEWDPRSVPKVSRMGADGKRVVPEEEEADGSVVVEEENVLPPSRRVVGERNLLISVFNKARCAGKLPSEFELRYAEDTLMKGHGQWGPKMWYITTFASSYRLITSSDISTGEKDERLDQLRGDFAECIARFLLDFTHSNDVDHLKFLEFLAMDADLRFLSDHEAVLPGQGFSYKSGACDDNFGIVGDAIARLLKLRSSPSTGASPKVSLKRTLKECQFGCLEDSKTGRTYFYHKNFHPGAAGEEASKSIRKENFQIRADLTYPMDPPSLVAAKVDPAAVKAAKKERQGLLNKFTLACGVSPAGLLCQLRVDLYKCDFVRAIITQKKMNKDQSLNQLTRWAQSSSLSLENLKSGIEVAKDCKTATVRFSEMLEKAEKMSEEEKSEVKEKVSSKRKASLDRSNNINRKKRRNSEQTKKKTEEEDLDDGILPVEAEGSPMRSPGTSLEYIMGEHPICLTAQRKGSAKNGKGQLVRRMCQMRANGCKGQTTSECGHHKCKRKQNSALNKWGTQQGTFICTNNSCKMKHWKMKHRKANPGGA